MSENRSARWLWLSLAVIVADRATKFAIERYTSPFFRRPIISDIVVLVHNQNPGIAFGVFSDSGSPWLTAFLVVSSGRTSRTMMRREEKGSLSMAISRTAS